MNTKVKAKAEPQQLSCLFVLSKFSHGRGVDFGGNCSPVRGRWCGLPGLACPRPSARWSAVSAAPRSKLKQSPVAAPSVTARKDNQNSSKYKTKITIKKLQMFYGYLSTVPCPAPASLPDWPPPRSPECRLAQPPIQSIFTSTNYH